MVTKTFERIVHFRQIQTTEGPIWLPLVQVGLIGEEEKRVDIALIFDTGAGTTTLRAEFAPLLGAEAWTDGEPVTIATAGGEVIHYRFAARLKVLGRVLECPVNLAQLPQNPVYQGYLGRDAVFQHFGFGFWEKDRELLITTNP